MKVSDELPIALQTIVERLKFGYQGPTKVGRFCCYEVDLSDWSLSLSDSNPCIWVRVSDQRALSENELAENLRDVVFEQQWQNNAVLVFVDGPVNSLRSLLPRVMPSFVVFDQNQQQQIQQADSPTAVTLDIFLKQMSRSQLAPYATNKPVVGSQFFGRKSEINKVLGHPNTNYLFMGIRRIGKTSLLLQLKRLMDRKDPPNKGQIRRLYVDCTSINTEEEFLRELTYRLDRSEMKMLMGRAAQSARYQSLMFDRFASIHGEPVTIFLDELDRFLSKIPEHSELFDVLRKASNAGRVRFIMAGFRKAIRAAGDQSSPFFNLATTINLGRLKKGDVEEMVLLPLERLRVSIENREGIVNRIYRETSGFPNYVQYYCQTLLEQLDNEKRDLLTENDLGLVYENREFRNFIIETFVSNTEPLEQALIYAIIAENTGPTQKRDYSIPEMDQILKHRNLDLDIDDLDRTCRDLEVAGIFEQVGKNYQFAVPLFQRMINESRNVEFYFKKKRDKVRSSDMIT